MKFKKSLIWTASVIGAGAVMSLLFGAIDRPDVPRTVSVTGNCTTSVPRDRTAITLRVTTLDKNAATSMRMATAITGEITKFLAGRDVEMQTTEFNSYEKNQWNQELQKSETVGIETSISIEVSAHSIDTIESVLNAFAGRENIYPENLRMYTSPAAMQPAIEKCLDAATQNARLRADALIAGENHHAGKILSVSYGTTATPSVPMPRMMTKMATADTGVNTYGTLVSRDTDVSVSVSATFEIR